jgi:hypothetical protein
MGQHEAFSARRAAGNQITGCATNHQSTGYLQEGLSSVYLELPPYLVSTKQQRDVAGIFPIGLSDNPCLSVGRSPSVRRGELIESKNPMAASCQLKSRRTPHRPEADDNDRAHCTP